MKPQELQNLIEELEKPDKGEEPYFGIFFPEKYDEIAYLKANKKGLEQVAALFLKAVSKVDAAKANNEGIYLELNGSKSWFDKESELTINFIEIVGNKPLIKDEYQPKWHDTLMKYGCIFMIVMGIVAAIIGLFTIGDWLLN